MRLIDADLLEFDTEWSEYMDGYTSYSQFQIDNAPTVDAVVIKSDAAKDIWDNRTDNGDLIDRGALCASLFPLGKKDAADIYSLIMEAPSVKRWVPRSERSPEARRGRWIDNGKDKFICSSCNGYVYRQFGRSDFCPRCGEKMSTSDVKE